jgi:mannose-6-phosphate isomerase-like protein (cupin superfamily)
VKANATELLAILPGPRSQKYPDGARFVEAFAREDMLTELYAPRGVDPQTPHDRDELYFVIAGTGDFVLNGSHYSFTVGDAFFVPAHASHRFENFSHDFMTWVVFWGKPPSNAKAS